MAVIWHLDLREIRWRKFKSSNMFSRVYHLRRTKMIVYQVAMVLTLFSIAIGTAAFTAYSDQQSAIEEEHPGVSLDSKDFVNGAIYHMVVGSLMSAVFSTAFLFDLFWPERRESKAVRLAWKISAVAISSMMFSSVLTITIITASKSASISGIDGAAADSFLEEAQLDPPPEYRKYPKALASIVFAWPALVATAASTVTLFVSHRHDDLNGPKSAYGRSLENGSMDTANSGTDDDRAVYL